ncbi:hypothetical protein KC717_02950 [Candidatus Dojkabacteria bacterium]|uniref:Aspartate/glutamate/uridylate kinase domain-containing protein n=1 Tax=Candidatus Dojkabacteria bacterium TaxID=2099670 RepID=A0A955L8S1_9BACT|nr:hypothetical protein [Candidatus Dojkabacteria bacterium]
MNKPIVVKLGGSVVSREGVLFDFEYLTQLRAIVEKRIEQDDSFCFILGGGATMRHYRDLAKAAGITERDQHWIGTTVNVLHAEIARSFFSDIAEERPVIYEQYYDDKHIDMKKPLLFGGGGRPGHSGDVDAILMADKVGATTVVSFKNIDYLYTADPKTDPKAEKVIEATWEEYFSIIGNKDSHEPGGNYIVDPVASKMASERNYRFVILEGTNLENIENYFNGEDFSGSVIG